MIIQKNNPVLKETAKEVRDCNSSKIKDLIKKMAAAMFEEPDGIGIAAPQIEVSLRIFLVSEDVLCIADGVPLAPPKDRHKGYVVFINPVFKKLSVKKTKDMEGCLSVRGVYGEVTRAEKVTVEYLDEKGKKHQRGASNLFARVLQHEMDHLNGTLFIDKAKNIKKL